MITSGIAMYPPPQVVIALFLDFLFMNRPVVGHLLQGPYLALVIISFPTPLQCRCFLLPPSWTCIGLVSQGKDKGPTPQPPSPPQPSLTVLADTASASMHFSKAQHAIQPETRYSPAYSPGPTKPRVQPFFMKITERQNKETEIPIKMQDHLESRVSQWNKTLHT